VLPVAYTFWQVIWSMFVFFLWVMFILIVIRVFMDIFHREDLSGWSKALWTIFVIFVPFLGVIVYMIVRPKMTEQDQRELMQVQEAQRRMEGYSSADEIAKLTELRNQGAISDEEFERLKQKALA
jgi:uncharacterized membrane protein